MEMDDSLEATFYNVALYVNKGFITLSKIVTLNQNYEFKRLYRSQGIGSPLLVTYIRKNHLGYNRIGITASKKIGKAHERNRARRVVREAYRSLAPLISSKNGWDIVFVVRTKTTLCKMQDVYKVMKNHLVQKAIINV